MDIRRNRKSFFVEVEDRTKETLLARITKWIHPDTTIVGDGWKYYQCLKIEVYLHLIVVNQRYNSVNPNTGAHIKLIDR